MTQKKETTQKPKFGNLPLIETDSPVSVLAELFAASGLFPDMTPEQIAVQILIGHELGIGAARAMFDLKIESGVIGWTAEKTFEHAQDKQSNDGGLIRRGNLKKIEFSFNSDSPILPFMPDRGKMDFAAKVKDQIDQGKVSFVRAWDNAAPGKDQTATVAKIGDQVVPIVFDESVPKDLIVDVGPAAGDSLDVDPIDRPITVTETPIVNADESKVDRCPACDHPLPVIGDDDHYFAGEDIICKKLDLCITPDGKATPLVRSTIEIQDDGSVSPASPASIGEIIGEILTKTPETIDHATPEIKSNLNSETIDLVEIPARRKTFREQLEEIDAEKVNIETTEIPAIGDEIEIPENGVTNDPEFFIDEEIEPDNQDHLFPQWRYVIETLLVDLGINAAPRLKQFDELQTADEKHKLLESVQDLFRKQIEPKRRTIEIVMTEKGVNMPAGSERRRLFLDKYGFSQDPASWCFKDCERIIDKINAIKANARRQPKK
jgi:hypothetical protein